MSTTLQKINQLARQPLSSQAIIRAIPGASVMLYRDIAQLGQLPDLPLFLLYETSPKSGHWVVILDTINGRGLPVIEHFDSYGLMPDAELNFVPPAFRARSQQDHTHLLGLLLASGRPIVYNHIAFQQLGDMATCGRWCILRQIRRDLPIEEFETLIGDLTRTLGLSADQLVVFLTEGAKKKSRGRRRVAFAITEEGPHAHE